MYVVVYTFELFMATIILLSFATTTLTRTIIFTLARTHCWAASCAHELHNVDHSHRVTNHDHDSNICHNLDLVYICIYVCTSDIQTDPSQPYQKQVRNVISRHNAIS